MPKRPCSFSGRPTVLLSPNFHWSTTFSLNGCSTKPQDDHVLVTKSNTNMSQKIRPVIFRHNKGVKWTWTINTVGGFRSDIFHPRFLTIGSPRQCQYQILGCRAECCHANTRRVLHSRFLCCRWHVRPCHNQLPDKAKKMCVRKVQAVAYFTKWQTYTEVKVRAFLALHQMCALRQSYSMCAHKRPIDVSTHTVAGERTLLSSDPRIVRRCVPQI